MSVREFHCKAISDKRLLYAREKQIVDLKIETKKINNS